LSYYYTAYLQVICSEIELPEFLTIPFSSQPDIRIFKKKSTLPVQFYPDTIVAEKRGDCIEYICPNRVIYRICTGDEIYLFSNTEVEPDLERLPLSGFVLASVLYQQGLWVFHGSAIEVDGKAVVVVGDKTAGKSTLVSSFIAKGHRLISDDVTAISIKNNEMFVLPGIPTIKLWPDAAAGIGLEANSLPRIFQHTEKRNYTLKEKFCDQERRIDTVIALGYGEKLAIKELSTVQKMLTLSCSHYFSNFQQLFSPEEKKSIFLQCAFLSENLKVIQLDRPWDLGLLAQTVETIIMRVSEKNER
jgi:hypothetical protein